MKFTGSENEFVALLNKYFHQERAGQQKGNQFQYCLLYNKERFTINLYKNGTVQIQPENEALNKEICQVLESNGDAVCSQNKTIFIVHGHDSSKEELELILRRWDLNPCILQNEDSKGKTIIEFLEHTFNSSFVAIVLLTPDDMGYSKKDGEAKIQPRARQNVILELGMVIKAIGREKCIILKKSDVEIPSDIGGLVYIEYNKDVKEITEQLRIKLKNLGVLIEK